MTLLRVYLYTIYTENLLVYILYICEYWCDFILLYISYTMYTEKILVYILYILQYRTLAKNLHLHKASVFINIISLLL